MNNHRIDEVLGKADEVDRAVRAALVPFTERIAEGAVAFIEGEGKKGAAGDAILDTLALAVGMRLAIARWRAIEAALCKGHPGMSELLASMEPDLDAHADKAQKRAEQMARDVISEGLKGRQHKSN